MKAYLFLINIVVQYVIPYSLLAIIIEIALIGSALVVYKIGQLLCERLGISNGSESDQ